MSNLEKFKPKINYDKSKNSWFNLPAAVLISLGSIAVGVVATKELSKQEKIEIINNNHGSNCPCMPCRPHKHHPHSEATTTTEPPVTTTTTTTIPYKPPETTTTTTIPYKPPVTTTTTTTIPYKPPVTTTTLPGLGSGYGYGN